MLEEFRTILLDPGMRIVEEPDGALLLSIRKPHGKGAMRTMLASSDLLFASVDFELEACPVLAGQDEARGTWITLDYCQEGRCEVALPGESAIVVKPGDCCLSVSRRMPDEYRFPLGRYRGIKLCFNERTARDPALALLIEAGIELATWDDKLSLAAVYEGDARLNALMESFGTLLDPFEPNLCKLRFMEVLLHIRNQGLPNARPRSYYTKTQMGIARTVHEQLCADLSADYDLPSLARGLGISVTSLNNYFQGVYGSPAPTYLRERRMREAARLLTTCDASVADIAALVGYANPSKFGAAFKRTTGAAPTEYRRVRTR